MPVLLQPFRRAEYLMFRLLTHRRAHPPLVHCHTVCSTARLRTQTSLCPDLCLLNSKLQPLQNCRISLALEPIGKEIESCFPEGRVINLLLIYDCVLGYTLLKSPNLPPPTLCCLKLLVLKHYSQRRSSVSRCQLCSRPPVCPMPRLRMIGKDKIN